MCINNNSTLLISNKNSIVRPDGQVYIYIVIRVIIQYNPHVMFVISLICVCDVYIYNNELYQLISKDIFIPPLLFFLNPPLRGLYQDKIIRTHVYKGRKDK